MASLNLHDTIMTGSLRYHLSYSTVCDSPFSLYASHGYAGIYACIALHCVPSGNVSLCPMVSPDAMEYTELELQLFADLDAFGTEEPRYTDEELNDLELAKQTRSELRNVVRNDNLRSLLECLLEDDPYVLASSDTLN